MRYGLACYADQPGSLKDAKVWLDRALEVADDADQVKLMALDDPDLESLWKDFGGLKVGGLKV